MKPKHFKVLREKSKQLTVRLIRPGRRGDPFTAIVGSSSNAVFNHFVTVKFKVDGTIQARCTCPWAEHGGVARCHVLAPLSRLGGGKKGGCGFWTPFAEDIRQKGLL